MYNKGKIIAVILVDIQRRPVSSQLIIGNYKKSFSPFRVFHRN